MSTRLAVVLLVSVLAVSLVAPAHAAGPTACADWKPNLVNELLCKLGLIGPPQPAGPAPQPEPTPAPTPTPTPAPNDPVGCGAPVLKSDGTAWTCTFFDNFDGTSLDRSKWVPQTNFANGSATVYACYIDDPAVISVSGGHLNLSVRQMPEPVTACPANRAASPYAAGQVSTFYQFSQQYGRFEARMKVPLASGPGLQEAFWLWPDVRYHSTATWPLSGEIDIVETYSQYPYLAIPFLHYSADLLGPQPGVNTAWDCVAYRGEWNTYTLEWTANRLEILVNGQSCLVNTSGDPAFNKRYIIALTQALGTGANAYGGSGMLPATTQIDYVRVWK
jgi:beta-glucanase (GH16 family)